MSDYLPATDAGLRDWATNALSKIAPAPLPWGVSTETATLFGDLTAAYDTAYQAATDPQRRGKKTCLEKSQKRQLLTACIRKMVRQIQANPAVTDVMRSDLGITIRKTEPTPSKEPGTPELVMGDVDGRVVSFRLWDADNETNRGKPPGVVSAGIFSYVGDEAPEDPAAYKFETLTTRTSVSILFPDSVPSGATVWICACWYSPKGVSGIACSPVSTTLQGGPARAQAA